MGCAQIAKAANLKSTGEKNGDVDYIVGAGANSRKSANDLIGVGEEFGKMSDKSQIALMKKEKKNASTAFFGGIEATNDEIMAHNNGKDAIKDMRTAAKEKGIASSAHASKIREEYGSDLNGKSKSGKTLAENTKESLAKDEAELENLGAHWTGSEEDKAKAKELGKRIETAQGILASNPQNMTLAQVTGNLETSKIQSTVGQAAGIGANINSGVNYAQNAFSGELNKQQATKASLEKQHGVTGALANEITNAQEKGTIGNAHASNMRTRFGENLEDAAGVVSNVEKDAAKKDKEEAQKEKKSLGSTKADKEKSEALDKRIAEDNKKINNNDTMTFAEQSAVSDMSKISSALGAAEGIKKNTAKGVSYGLNAEYGEESKQQSTNELISKQGGLKSAVNTAVTEAGQKASQQQGAVEGLQSEAQKIGDKIGKSAADVIKNTAKDMAAGKIGSDTHEISLLNKENAKNGGYVGAMETAGAMKAVSTLGSIEKPEIYTAQNMKKFHDEMIQKGVSESSLSDLKNADGSFKTGIDAAAVMAQHAAGNVQGQHGVVFGNKSIGASFSKDGVRVGLVDDSTQKKSGDSTKLDDSFSVSTGTQIKGTTLDLTAWTEVSAKMAHKYGAEAIKGAVADVKNGNFHNFRKMAEGTFGKENGDNATDSLKAQWNSSDDSDRLGEALLVGAATGTAYGLDKKFNKGKAYDYVKNKLSGQKPESNEQTMDGSNDNQPNETNKQKTNNIHNDSFEGKKFNEAGGKTQAYQSHLDSVAKNVERGKFIKSLASHGKVGAIAAGVADLAYEAYEHIPSVQGAVDWMTSSHSPAGGSHNIPGSSQFNKGHLPHISSDSVMNAADAVMTASMGFGALFVGTDLGGDLKMNTGNNGGVPFAPPAWAQDISPVAASVLQAGQAPSGGGFVAPTMVQQAVDNHANTQQFAQAIAAQGPQYGPTATEASTSRMADIMQDNKNQALSFNKKMEINSNAAYTKDTMNHKELMEFNQLSKGLNPDSFDGEKS